MYLMPLALVTCRQTPSSAAAAMMMMLTMLIGEMDAKLDEPSQIDGLSCVWVVDVLRACVSGLVWCVGCCCPLCSADRSAVNTATIDCARRMAGPRIRNRLWLFRGLSLGLLGLVRGVCHLVCPKRKDS